MAKRREASVFNLSFLDIMSCGFGAVILIYIVIHHASETSTGELNREMMAEARRLEIEVEKDRADLARLKNVLIETSDEIITTDGLAMQITREINDLKGKIARLDTSGSSQKDSIDDLKSELKRLEDELATLEGSVAASEAAGSSRRSVVGEGDRQYLTGLRIGGERILILLDGSASMLDETIVNIIRLRNMSPQIQRQSDKWRRAIRTVEWILANMPPASSYQLIVFNDRASTLVTPDEGEWIAVADKAATDKVVTLLNEMVPAGGTSLHAAYHKANSLAPAADNVFLIVDGLPTMSAVAPKSTQITSRERNKLFWDSLEHKPANATMNIILLPMEGDPLAAPAYWQLAQQSGGTFLSPPRDWP
ncbi:MAG: VWA domain-containing protein [Gammaproteobacteria bacterium]|nr:VWA domain-containing protein [Gammaproteobacteria bacterium]